MKSITLLILIGVIVAMQSPNASADGGMLGGLLSGLGGGGGLGSGGGDPMSMLMQLMQNSDVQSLFSDILGYVGNDLNKAGAAIEKLLTGGSITIGENTWDLKSIIKTITGALEFEIDETASTLSGMLSPIFKSIFGPAEEITGIISSLENGINNTNCTQLYTLSFLNKTINAMLDSKDENGTTLWDLYEDKTRSSILALKCVKKTCFAAGSSCNKTHWKDLPTAVKTKLNALFFNYSIINQKMNDLIEMPAFLSMIGGFKPSQLLMALCLASTNKHAQITNRINFGTPFNLNHFRNLTDQLIATNYGSQTNFNSSTELINFFTDPLKIVKYVIPKSLGCFNANALTGIFGGLMGGFMGK